MNESFRHPSTALPLRVRTGPAPLEGALIWEQALGLEPRPALEPLPWAQPVQALEPS
jgi:hypothetical protein